jgi:hypothetical protein
VTSSEKPALEARHMQWLTRWQPRAPPAGATYLLPQSRAGLRGRSSPHLPAAPARRPDHGSACPAGKWACTAISAIQYASGNHSMFNFIATGKKFVPML